MKVLKVRNSINEGLRGSEVIAIENDEIAVGNQSQIPELEFFL